MITKLKIAAMHVLLVYRDLIVPSVSAKVCPSTHQKIQVPKMEESSPISRQSSIIPKPELRGFGGDSLTKPPFKVTSAEVVIICPAI